MTTIDETRTLRVGLIGYGLGGAAFHAPLVATTAGMRLAAIVTANPERRAQAARAHPDARLVDSVDDLWMMAPELDLVVVASPNRAHVPHAMAALAHGLHVVIDKPIAPSADAARALAEEAHRRGRLAIPYHNRRWDGDLRTLRRLIAAGALGDVLRFESRFERWRPEPKAGWKESADPAEVGGILYDLGSHLIDQALVLFGPATHVYAEVDRRRAGVAVDDDAFVALTHASGVRSHLHVGALVAQQGPRLRALGTRAAYVKHGMDVQEEALKAGARPGPGWGEEPEAGWGLLGVEGHARPVRTEPGAYPAFYAGVAAAIAGGAPPPVAIDDAIAGLAIIEAARRSAAERRVVELAPA